MNTNKLWSKAIKGGGNSVLDRFAILVLKKALKKVAETRGTKGGFPVTYAEQLHMDCQASIQALIDEIKTPT